MPMYTPLHRVAERLSVTVDKLREWERFGWISVVERNGDIYIPGHHEYKAKFILHLLQVRKLNAHQVSRVLLAEKPPYSLADIDRILAEEPDGRPRPEKELVHESRHSRR
jgi:DNA-binding transcriptional MerR regulator